MTKKYEWSLIPYPYFRAFNLFTAFILTAITVGIITTTTIEVRDYYKEQENAKLKELERENNVVVKQTNSESSIDNNIHSILLRAIYVGFISACISFFTYLIMYLIFGFGGAMVSPKRKWRLFSSIPA
jgi:1,4-dihydroxy-2-naphthoate octaprenyltransferase